MAKMKLSAIGITNLSGKSGGSIFSHNQGGKYVKNFAVPSNPQSQAQMQQRSNFGAFASAWKTLTEAQRNAWKAASSSFPYLDAFGDTIHLSGIALFISLNRNLKLIGEPGVDNPPVPEGVDSITDLQVTASIDPGTSPGVIQINGDVNANADAETQYLIYATPALSAGVSSASNRFRVLTEVSETLFTSGNDVGPEWEAVFGTMQVGSKIILKAVPINSATGERGAMYQASAIVSDPTP